MLWGVSPPLTGQQGEPPVVSLVRFVRQRTGHAPTTFLMVLEPDGADLNGHTGTYYGRLNGGQLLARSPGEARHPLVLGQGEWVALVTGEQGATGSRSAR